MFCRSIGFSQELETIITIAPLYASHCAKHFEYSHLIITMTIGVFTIFTLQHKDKKTETFRITILNDKG